MYNQTIEQCSTCNCAYCSLRVDTRASEHRTSHILETKRFPVGVSPYHGTPPDHGYAPESRSQNTGMLSAPDRSPDPKAPSTLPYALVTRFTNEERNFRPSRRLMTRLTDEERNLRPDKREPNLVPQERSSKKPVSGRPVSQASAYRGTRTASGLRDNKKPISQNVDEEHPDHIEKPRLVEKTMGRKLNLDQPGFGADGERTRDEKLSWYNASPLLSVDAHQPRNLTEPESQTVVIESLSQNLQPPIINKSEESNISESNPSLDLSLAPQVQTPIIEDLNKETCKPEQVEIVFGCESGLRACQALEKLRLNPRGSFDVGGGPQLPEQSKKEPDKAREIVFKMLRKYVKNGHDSSSDFGLSFEDMVKKYDRFRQKAVEAFKKLQIASVSGSEELQSFVFSDLRTLDNIIDIGQSTLCEFVDCQKQKPPDNLVNLYCMLHVCYAMSRAAGAESPQFTNDQFAMAASEWKDCLMVEKDPEIRRQKEDLFDEIKEIMWVEFKEGLEYAMLFRDRACMEPNSIPHRRGDFDTNDPLASQNLFDPTYDVDTGLGDFEPDWGSFLDVDFLDSDSDSNFRRHEQPKFLDGLEENIPPDKANLEPPTGKRLIGNVFVTAVFTFVQELQETGIVFLYLCGSLAVSTLRRFLELSTSPVPKPPEIHLHERQHIIESLQKNLKYERHPESSRIIDAVSGPFLAGIIDTFHDLEECIINFMKITIFDPHSLLCFFTLLTTHFYSYYHKSLPQRLKCTAEVYNSPVYVPERIRAGEKILAISKDNMVDTVSTPHASQDAATLPKIASSDTKARKRKAAHDENETLAMKASMKRFRCNNGLPKPSNAPKQLIFKNIMGEPRKRRNKPKNVVGVKA
ncbi:hypothetical protein H072_183 [Dactylellina haptotyla CBS 200.50]|uniref:Uncharacterized protein n=1 Tax=Dactylellina haptotyla (strain CBS 200.50) TaxID=1284197 RepID=S8AXW6_DACHA|nr:hypothetical protein H072_183 [Dactylellina haptotyla CBS 200.50]